MIGDDGLRVRTEKEGGPPFLRLCGGNARFALAKSLPDRRPNGIIDIMPTSRDLHPLTSEQAVQLRHDLTLVEERLQDIAILMRVCYGEDSQAVIRADETAAALQRLKWELERMQVRRQAAGSF